MTQTEALRAESINPKISGHTRTASESFDRTMAGLDDAAGFMARARLTRLGGRLEAGSTPNWLLVSLIIILIGLLIIAL
jgi:hypothetical protein